MKRTPSKRSRKGKAPFDDDAFKDGDAGPGKGGSRQAWWTRYLHERAGYVGTSNPDIACPKCIYSTFSPVVDMRYPSGNCSKQEFPIGYSGTCPLFTRKTMSHSVDYYMEMMALPPETA